MDLDKNFVNHMYLPKNSPSQIYLSVLFMAKTVSIYGSFNG